MFGIGPTELLVILLVGVVVLGPEQLPKIMRTMTKVMSDVRRVSTDFQRTINLEANKEEWEQKQAETTVKKKKKKKAVPRPEPETAGQETPGAVETAAAETAEAPAVAETVVDAAPAQAPGEEPAAAAGEIPAQTAEKREPDAVAHPGSLPADAHGGRS